MIPSAPGPWAHLSGHWLRRNSRSRGGGAVGEGGGQGECGPGGEQAGGVGGEEDGGAARREGDGDGIARGVQEGAVERRGDAEDPKRTGRRRIPDATPRAAELKLGDSAGAGARGEAQDKRAIEGAVGGTGAIALADTIPGVARKGQAQRGRCPSGPNGGGRRGGGAVGERGGQGECGPGGEQAGGVGGEEDGGAARREGDGDGIAGGVQEGAVERRGDAEDPKGAGRLRIPDTTGPRAAELELGDGAGAGARGEGQDKRAIEGAVGGPGAIAPARRGDSTRAR